MLLRKKRAVEFANAYDDRRRAEAYARLQFPGTYYLAFRDLPRIIAKHCLGQRALDFGCGAGRSTRFLKELGFTATGVDISAEMLRKAKEFDPTGDYRLLGEDGFEAFPSESFDLVLSAFTFDNIPERSQKAAIMRDLRRLLASGGTFVNLVSSPEIYYHEWASFTTKDFPENRAAKPGDIVKIINTDIDDARPVDDILWPDENYRESYRESSLEVIEMHKPLGRANEGQPWVQETRIAPWVIYVLKPA